MPTLAETWIEIELDKPRKIIVNGNTMAAYEEVSGKNYWDTYLGLIDIQTAAMAQIAEPQQLTSTEGRNKVGSYVIRHLCMRDLKQLIWASLHEYSPGSDVPRWPLTLDQVGRHINARNAPGLLPKFLSCHSINNPTADELGEAEAGSAPPPSAAPAQLVEMRPATSGDPSIDVPADAFA